MIRRCLLLGWLAGTLAATAAPAAPRSGPPANPVKAVQIKNEGAGVVDAASVLAFTSVKPGEEFSAHAVSRDVKTLQKSGRFSYVASRVEETPDGLVLTYVVKSKPRISRLEVAGADYLGNKKVRDILELGVGDLVDDGVLAAKALKVTEKYQKKYFPHAKLTWTIRPDEPTGTADVRITVVEGRRASIKHIRFTGNDHLTARVLRKAMQQRQANWLSWFTSDGTYDPDQLETDLVALRKVFLDAGFLDVKIGEPQIVPYGPKKIDIQIPVTEQQLYHVQGLGLQGVTLFPETDVRAGLKVRPGDLASVAQIEKASQAVKDFYGARGYLFTSVTTEYNANLTNHVVDLLFRVKEGKLSYINNIKVRGNYRTKDKVIRRELAVYPGEIYNEVKVRTSENRLKNLGYFSYVNAVPESTAQPGQYDMVVDVEEQKTGQFVVGAGFSSVDNLIGFVELSQGNFDITDWPRFSGGGQKVRVRAQFGSQRQDYEFEFIEPWFLNRRLSLGFNLFQHVASYLSHDYDQRNTGGSVTLGKPLTAHDRLNLTYGLEEYDIYNVSTNASELIQQEAGRRLKSYVTTEVVHDTRDSFFVSTRGNRTSLSATLAGGPLGGDTDDYTLQARSSQFFPLWFDHVFNLRGWAATVKEYGDSPRVPLFDRMFLGGPRSLRGFKYRYVGPKDEDGEPIGGRSALYGTAEYTVPVAEKVRLAAFYDAGMVWEEAYTANLDDLNSDVGGGVRFDFPGFPIQLDYSWPIQHDAYNDRPQGRFSFWIGYIY